MMVMAMYPGDPRGRQSMATDQGDGQMPMIARDVIQRLAPGPATVQSAGVRSTTPCVCTDRAD